MKRLLGFFKGYRKECALGPLFKLLEACLELLVPLVVARLIDVAVPAGEAGRPEAVKLSLLLVLLGLVGLGFSVTAQWFAAKAAVGFSSAVRRALYRHIGSFSTSQVDRHGGATLITRLTGDMNQVQTGVNLTLRLLLRSPLVVFGAAAMAFAVDGKEALIFVAAIPALAVIVFAIMLVSIPLYKKVQQKLDAVLSHTRDTLTGVRVLRAFRREEAEKQAFYEKNRALTEGQRFVGRITALQSPVTYVVLNAAILVLLYTGAVRIDGGTLTPGQLVALYNYLTQILVELVKLADLILNVTRSLACADRVADVLNEEPEDPAVTAVVPQDKAGGLAVSFEHVGFRYPGAGGNALTDVNLSVPAGAHVGVIGPTGSGKSTLVHLIPRLFEATEGRVTVDNVDVKDQEAAVLRGQIALVPQKVRLFAGTVRDNLLMGDPSADDDRLNAALATAQAADVVTEKGGLDAEVKAHGRNFSGGQRQRLAIARALVRRPRILILDDSSSALDFLTDRALRMALRRYDAGMTVFTVAQRATALRDCDVILVLDEGRVAGVGTHDELLNTCPLYREICASQE